MSNPDTSGAVSSALNFTVTGALVSVVPSTAQVPATGLQQFSATVLGPSNTAVTWSVNGVGGGNSTVGTITAGGLYTAPTTVPNPATVTVTATSQALPSVSSSASLTIGPYTEKPVYSFTSLTDGAAPSSSLLQGSDGYYYAIAQMGGANGYGTVFKLDSSGNVTPLHEFSYMDGANPLGALIQASDGYLYGTTQWGGASGDGTIFKVDSTGNLTTFYSFTGGDDGAQPLAGVIQASDGYLYGTTWYGGTYDSGTVYKIGPSGNLTTLYSFSGGTDGAAPWSALIQAQDGYFYGTTSGGGGSSFGTIFRMDSAGNLNTLYSFTGGADGGLRARRCSRQTMASSMGRPCTKEMRRVPCPTLAVAERSLGLILRAIWPRCTSSPEDRTGVYRSRHSFRQPTAISMELLSRGETLRALSTRVVRTTPPTSDAALFSRWTRQAM